MLPETFDLRDPLDSVVDVPSRIPRLADVHQRTKTFPKFGIDDLNLTYDIQSHKYPGKNLGSLHDVLGTLRYPELFEKEHGFATETNIKCFVADSNSVRTEWVNDSALRQLLDNDLNNESCKNSSPKNSTLMVFFVPITPCTDPQLPGRISLTKGGAEHLFEHFKLNPSFLLQIFGPPSEILAVPQFNLETSSDGKLTCLHFFCQHARWDLETRGTPVSSYLRYDKLRNKITYIISFTQADKDATTLSDLLDATVAATPSDRVQKVFLSDPFDIHILLSTLNFETSQIHLMRFQRLMWLQMKKVNDHLAGLEYNDRAKLGELTTQLHAVSQKTNSHIANANVAFINAKETQDFHEWLHTEYGRKPWHYAGGAIKKILLGTEKQKLWLGNYNARKESIMTLVYNLVTQHDAENNILLASDMRRDSTSMKVIAALGMIFLPGTFTAAVLDAGIFTVVPGKGIIVNEIWRLWTGITVPLTLLVIALWLVYKKKKEISLKPAVSLALRSDDHVKDDMPAQDRMLSFKSFLPRRRARTYSQAGRV